MIVRDAAADDVGRVCAFGADHVPPHYTPLIGPTAAQAQVTTWWTEDAIAGAVAQGLVVVAEDGDRLVGVAQRGRAGEDHAVYKLYVDPEHRGRGLGVRLLAAVVDRLPPGATRLGVEHFAANARAGAFYEREGFGVERVERHPSDPALDVVWCVRVLGPS